MTAIDEALTIYKNLMTKYIIPSENLCAPLFSKYCVFRNYMSGGEECILRELVYSEVIPGLEYAHIEYDDCHPSIFLLIRTYDLCNYMDSHQNGELWEMLRIYRDIGYYLDRQYDEWVNERIVQHFPPLYYQKIRARKEIEESIKEFRRWELGIR